MSQSELASPKTANPGTLMFRRSDVVSRLKRHYAIYLNNMRAAKREGNEEWREVQLQKLRTVMALTEDVFAKCPVFENASAIEAQSALRARAASTPSLNANIGGEA